MTRSSTLEQRATSPDVSRRRIPADMDVLSQLQTYFPLIPEVKQALLKAKPRPRTQDYQLFSELMSGTLFEILSRDDATEQTIRSILDGAQRKLDQ